ncbi:hypothetical protein [Streptomyces sp. NPDC001750]|uniref:hypothetical protein n=1 Tax=Streptomyces sp. NPDC001750 TaxID=3364607 RepID=UPI0036BD5FFF
MLAVADDGRDLDEIIATERLILPTGPDLVSEALTAQSNARAQALQARIEAAIVNHCAEAHPGR